MRTEKDPTYKRFMAAIERAAQPSGSSSGKAAQASTGDYTGKKTRPRKPEGTSSKRNGKSPSKKA